MHLNLIVLIMSEDDAIKKGIQKIYLNLAIDVKTEKKNIAGKNRLVIDGGHFVPLLVKI